MNVYVYETYNDSKVFDERTITVFLNKSEALKALKQSVEKFFDKDWRRIKDEEIGSNDWFAPDHVSYSPDGEIVYYWEITPFYTSENRYCTEDEIANEIDVMCDMLPEWNTIPESAYAEITKNVLELIDASDGFDNLSDLISTAIENYLLQHPELEAVEED